MKVSSRHNGSEGKLLRLVIRLPFQGFQGNDDTGLGKTGGLMKKLADIFNVSELIAP